MSPVLLQDVHAHPQECQGITNTYDLTDTHMIHFQAFSYLPEQIRIRAISVTVFRVHVGLNFKKQKPVNLFIGIDCTFLGLMRLGLWCPVDRGIQHGQPQSYPMPYRTTGVCLPCRNSSSDLMFICHLYQLKRLSVRPSANSPTFSRISVMVITITALQYR